MILLSADSGFNVRHPDVSLEVVEDPCDSPRKSLGFAPPIGCSRIKVDVLSS